MKNFLSILLFCICIAGYSQTDYSYVYDSNAFIAKGIQLYQEKNYSAAIKEFDKVDKNDPKYYNAQYEKALVLAAGDDKDAAAKFFENAYSTGMMAELPDFYIAYGSFLSDQKQYEKAETLFKEAGNYFPEYSVLLYNMALLYVRMDKRQKSVELLERAIQNNPNHVGSHYLLGFIALENGNITEGTMALLAYLTLMPDGTANENVIQKLNLKYSENYLEKGKLVFSPKGDDFAEIEEILKNGLPLKSAYKVKSAFDDPIIRQVQAVVEYSAEHKERQGFFERIYVPWLADIASKKQFEGFSYHILLGVRERLGKKLTAHNSKIKDYTENYLQKGFWDVFAKRRVDLYGSQEEVVIYLQDGRPDYFGKEVNGKKMGRYKVLNKYGNIAAELNFADNELEGVQKYYGLKGKLLEEKTFSKGKLNGKRIVYFENGNFRLIEFYKDDKLDGLCTGYYINGGKSAEGNFSADLREGLHTEYYENGSKKTEANYLKGKLNGKYVYYDITGNVSNEQNFVNDERQGKLVEYYDGKIVKSEAEYDKGVIKNVYRAFYPDGSLKEESNYANRVLQHVVYYYGGKKSYEVVLDKEGAPVSYIYYDAKGNKYFIENYKKGEIKAGEQFTANNPQPVEVPVNKGTYTVKTLEGDIITSGKFNKGQKMGEWNYFYRSGVPRSKENFEKGLQNGKSYNYGRDGRINVVAHYVNDTLQGIYENYSSGHLTSVFHYRGGQANGPSRSYHEDGKLYAESFYINDDLYSKQVNYRQNGTVSQIADYVQNIMTKLQTFNTDGTKSNELDFTNKTGKITNHYNGGAEIHEFELKNGVYNGKYIVKEKTGKISVEAYYINGKRHGKYLKANPAGGPLIEHDYYAGQLNGESKFYDLAGNLRMTDTYLFGENTGTTVRYYAQKSKMSEVKQFNENKEGDMNYYNKEGQHILTLGYERDELIYYRIMDKTGKLTDKVPVKAQTAEIKSIYPGGRTAIEMNFVKGNLNGKFAIYSAEGKPEYEANYDMGLLQGVRKEYHSNGKVFKKENFKDSSYEGLQEYFGEDGKPLINAEYKNDELHGICNIYKAGVVSQTKRYDSNVLIEIK
ncbi:hypothetical protein CHU92_14340 [Flavobacterium cyanobacteriorum]|uniref:Uncharacterized protein n=1 Tax=Flavobacterium cyanobacteriorum TaxID=2022802 RepID=A0A255YS63_9FLAO|nr:tetratricopeptide repeat protein [Flavobacterium cyanobacteriorum]OYQ32058.1 hypothetical protein CHU92_14340 [Flavobacterium cyanobacteriorum]